MTSRGTQQWGLKPPWLNGAPGALLTALAMVVGSAATALAWRVTHEAETRSARAALSVQAADIQAEIEAHLIAYEGLLHSGAGLIDTLWPLTPEQWRTFTNQQSLASGYPGIHGVGFSVVFRSPEEASYWERELGSKKIYGYGTQSSNWRPESAIVLVEPRSERNLRALGFDTMSERVRREAVERARDQGSPALSGRITLVQELNKPNPEPGFILNVPVYEGGGVPASLAERRRKFRGVVYSAFRAAHFFGGTLSVSPHQAVFEVIDADPASGGFLYRNADAPSPNGYLEVRRLSAWGREWTLRVWPGVGASAAPRAAPIVAAAGVAITLLLAGVVATLSLSRHRLRERMEAAKAFAERERSMKAELEVRVADRTHELAERTAALEAANQKLATANRDLETFSYSVSHDLRSPLRAVGGHVEMFLACGDDPSKAQHHAAAIRSNIKRMAEMIDHLLKLALVSRQAFEKSLVDMGTLVKSVIEDVRRTYPEEIDFRYSAHELGQASADAALLRQVLTNLLMNAAKFSRHVSGPRIIHVGCRRLDTEQLYFVRDNGVGFDPRYANRLFGVFERLHSPQQFEGCGVGLAIVKQIVERHGGRVWAESQPGCGATFFFTLPAVPAPTAVAAA